MQVGVMLGSSSPCWPVQLAVTLLGTASPSRCASPCRTRKPGKVAGKIYTISTLGSFLGTFLPVLVLIPAIGTYRTFVSISAGLMLVSLFSLWRTAGSKFALRLLWMPLLLALATYFGLSGYDKQAQGIIYESESAYNYIQVQQVGDYRILRLNEGQGIHSIYHPTQEDFYGAWEQVLVAPYFNAAPMPVEDVQRIAILGLAAGTSARQAYRVYPQAQIDGFEIDPKIVQVGYDLFDMGVPTLNVKVQDARWGLAHTNQLYDSSASTPIAALHSLALVTREFFQETFDHLSQQRFRW